jgi:hypothetical protein
MMPSEGVKTVIELGYCLRPTFWGQGLAAQGSRKVLEHGFLKRRLNYVMAQTLKGKRKRKIAWAVAANGRLAQK